MLCEKGLYNINHDVTSFTVPQEQCHFAKTKIKAHIVHFMCINFNIRSSQTTKYACIAMYPLVTSPHSCDVIYIHS